MQEARLVTFRYDAEPELDLIFYQGSPENRVDFPNHADCGDRARVLKLDFHQTTWVRVRTKQTFFDGMVCHQVTGTVLVQDNLWSSGSVNPTLVNDCKQWCSQNLTTRTERFQGLSETFSMVEREIEPVPEKSSPHVNTYVLQYTSDTLGGASTQQIFTILTPGDVADPENDRYDVTFTDPILLTIVRDPPGDASVQTFSNVETHVVAHSTDYSAFFGAFNTLKSGAHLKFEGETCAFGVFCGTLTAFDTNLGLVVEEKIKRPTATSFNGGRTLSRTYTWSYSTPSMLNSALKKRTRGSDSDMFLVTAMAVVFIPTVRVKTNETSPCDGGHEILQTWLTVDQLRRLQGNIDTSPDTVMWVSRQDIRDRIIPQLLGDNDPENDKNISAWQQILARADKYKIVPPTVKQSDMERFEAALQDFAEHRDVTKLEVALGLDVVNALTVMGSGAATASAMRQANKDQIANANDKLKIVELDKEIKRLEAEAADSLDPFPIWEERNERLNEMKAVQNELADKARKYETKRANAIVAKTSQLGEKIGKKSAAFLGKVAPIVGLAFAILEVATVASYMSDVNTNVLDGGVNSARFQDQEDEIRAESQVDIFGDENMPSFKPFGSAARGLWGGNQIKRNEKNVLNRFDHDATMISFSGGGSTIEFGISDLDDSSLTSRIDGYSTEVKVGGYGMNGVSPGFSSDSSMTFEISTDLKQSNINRQSTGTSASVTLGDSSPGDYFLVQVLRDKEFGTFAFNTIAGLSSCPNEQGTIAREEPAISYITPPEPLIHPNEPATFHIKLENNALYDSASFTLNVGHLHTKDDARILVNGMTMDKPIVFESLEPLHSYPVLIQVYRGSENYEYDLEFDLRSMCEEELRGNLSVPIRFASLCPEVKLVGPLADGIYKIASIQPQIVPLSVRHTRSGSWLWSNFTNVKSVGFQFLQHDEDSWIDAQSIRADGDVIVDMISREDPVLHFPSFDWNLTLLNLYDATIRVRAVVECDPGPQVSALAPQNANLFKSYSQEGVFRVDRTPPLVYSVHPPLPFPGKDEIIVEFTEPIRCGPPLPFILFLSISGLPNDMIGLHFDPSSGNVLVQCKGNKIAFSIPSNIPARKLLNLKVVATLENVKDLVGNRAQANIAADSEKIQFQFQFANIDLDKANFAVRKIIVPGISDVGSCTASSAVEQLSMVTGLSTLKLFNLDFTNNVCIANLAIVGADVSWDQINGGRRLQETADIHDIGTYFDLLVAENVIQFASGGGVDVVPPQTTFGNLESKFDMFVSKILGDDQTNSTSNCSINIQQQLLFQIHSEQGNLKAQMSTNAADMNDLKTDLSTFQTNVNDLHVDMEKIKSDILLLQSSLSEIKSLLLGLGNGTTVAGSSQQDVLAEVESSNTMATAAIVVSVSMSFFALGVALFMVWTRSGRQVARNRDLSRATGDFAVVGHQKEGSLQFLAHNENFPAHPVFTSSDV